MQKPNHSTRVTVMSVATALAGLGAPLNNPATKMMNELSSLLPVMNNNNVGSFNRLSQKGRRRRARQRNSC